MVAWGWNEFGQATVPTEARSGVVAIAAGGEHTVALKEDGSVIAWGNNRDGQTTVPESAHSGVMAIAAGESHTVALKEDGSVIAWGSNRDGQITVPVGVQSGVVAIAAGEVHTLALKEDSSVVAWGGNTHRQTMISAGAQRGIVAIAAGDEHSVALIGSPVFARPTLHYEILDHGPFRLWLDEVPGSLYEIQSTTNLTSWETLIRGGATTGELEYTMPKPPQGTRLFRAWIP